MRKSKATGGIDQKRRRIQKRGGIEKRINREQVLCQRWGAMKARRRSRLGVQLPGDAGRGAGGGAVYLGAELGSLITPSIMAALNKRTGDEMRFHLHCCRFDPRGSLRGTRWVDRSTLGVDVRGRRGQRWRTGGHRGARRRTERKMERVDVGQRVS